MILYYYMAQCLIHFFYINCSSTIFNSFKLAHPYLVVLFTLFYVNLLFDITIFHFRVCLSRLSSSSCSLSFFGLFISFIFFHHLCLVYFDHPVLAFLSWQELLNILPTWILWELVETCDVLAKTMQMLHLIKLWVRDTLEVNSTKQMAANCFVWLGMFTSNWHSSVMNQLTRNFCFAIKNWFCEPVKSIVDWKGFSSGGGSLIFTLIHYLFKLC